MGVWDIKSVVCVVYESFRIKVVDRDDDFVFYSFEFKKLGIVEA